MQKYVFYFISLLVFILIFPSQSMAKSLSISLPTTTFNGEQEVVVTASVSGFQAIDEIFIKGSFYKESSTNYFGYTKYGDTWIKNSVTTVNQRKVTVGDWDGKLTVKPDYTDTGFSSDGSYLFKVGFYTISNSEPTSVIWSDNSVAVTLQKPPSTPTPTPSQTPTHTPTRTPTPQSTNTPTKTLTSTQTPTMTKKLTPTEEPTPTDESIEESEESPTPFVTSVPTPTPMILSSSEKRPLTIAFLFVGIGLGILSIVSFVSIYNKMKAKDDYTIKE